MSEKKCSNCGLWNPPNAMRCDCGFDFESSKIKASYADQTTTENAIERAEKNLPTLLVSGVTFVVVYLTVALTMYLVLGYKPSGIMLGIAFGLAAAITAMINIKVKKWF